MPVDKLIKRHCSKLLLRLTSGWWWWWCGNWVSQLPSDIWCVNIRQLQLVRFAHTWSLWAIISGNIMFTCVCVCACMFALVSYGNRFEWNHAKSNTGARQTIASSNLLPPSFKMSSDGAVGSGDNLRCTLPVKWHDITVSVHAGICGNFTYYSLEVVIYEQTTPLF